MFGFKLLNSTNRGDKRYNLLAPKELTSRVMLGL
jgi:hypothetical protein